MELVRKQTYITREQDRKLKVVAQQYRATEAEILRRALDLLLADEENKTASDPFEGFIGFAAGPTDVDHDDIYR
jgi:hypothetical protein